jgi:RimJ/RimL family protein N-acetyltransferase
VSRIVLPADPLADGATLLRPWRDSDLAALTAAAADPAIIRWTRVPDGYSEHDARAFLLQRYDAVLAGTTAPFAIVSPQDRLLGSISLMRLDREDRRGEVGYWLAREARGRGHATRAVRLISRWGFLSLGLERIDLYAATGNEASQRVAERSGFVREATLRAFMRGKDGPLDMVAFGLLSSGGELPRHGPAVRGG